MRKINYYTGILSLAIVCFFASCSTTKYGAHFQPSSHAPSHYAKVENGEEKELAYEEETIDVALKNAKERAGAEEVSTDIHPEGKGIQNLSTEVEIVDEKAIIERREKVLAETRERLQNLSRKEKKELRREIKKLKLAEYSKDLPAYDRKNVLQDGAEVNLLALILAFLLPPLGVFIHQGEINNKFWISLILTLLGVVPGIVYSVLVVLGVV